MGNKECHHGWRGSSPEDGERIVTPCPHCGCQSLFIGKGGHLTCARVPSHGSDGCGNPSVAEAVDRLKRERDTLLAWCKRNYAAEEGPGETDRQEYIDLRGILREIEKRAK